jgi:hypothetical protein
MGQLACPNACIQFWKSEVICGAPTRDSQRIIGRTQ